MAATALGPDFITQVVAIDIAPVAYQVRRHDKIFAALDAVTAEQAKTRQEATTIMRHHINEDGVIQFLLKSFKQGEWKFNLPALKTNYEKIIGWETVPAWNKPVLLIPGGNSPYVQAEYSDEIAQQFPKSQSLGCCGYWSLGTCRKTGSCVKSNPPFFGYSKIINHHERDIEDELSFSISLIRFIF